MTRYARPFFILCLLLLTGTTLLFAQSNTPQLAFGNSAGQLAVVSADGETRWIATNPGEQLHSNLAFSLSPDGNRLFYAVDGGNQASLRLLFPADGNIQEIAALSGNLSGGGWLNNRTLVVTDGTNLYACQPDCETMFTGSGLSLLSPTVNGYSGIAAEGHIFLNSSTGYLILRPDSRDVLETGTRGEMSARGSGQWAENALLVAYQGTADGQNVLRVMNTETTDSATLTGSSQIPFTVVGWIPDSASLLYRDATGQILQADVSCLLNSCSTNPFENSQILAPATADSLQLTDEALFFVANNSVQALSLDCGDTCLNSSITLAEDVLPRTMFSITGDTLFYTAQAGEGAELRFIDLSCLPDCSSELVLANAIGGALSADGDFLAVEIIGEGLHILNLNDLNTIYLSAAGRQPGALLTTARWSG